MFPFQIISKVSHYLSFQLVVVHVAQLIPPSRLTQDTHRDTPAQVDVRTQLLKLSGPHGPCASLAGESGACSRANFLSNSV